MVALKLAGAEMAVFGGGAEVGVVIAVAVEDTAYIVVEAGTRECASVGWGLSVWVSV